MPKLGRNDACHCGSGTKYKKCHLPQDEFARTSAKFINAVAPSDGLVRFDQFFPEIADPKGRALWVFGKDPAKHQPFFLMEFYCSDPKCDCNRVMIGVVDLDQEKMGTLVSISYAFDRNDPDPGPYVDPLNPITPIGRELFPLIKDMFLNDTAFVRRLQEHYKMVKEIGRAHV